ncbi:ankyrin repeat domain-containing protein [Wolbachia pipientis]|nr:ankyrin repeat domain-containing protein [Wolbachia pipientis]
MNGGVLNEGFNEELCDVSDQLPSTSNSLCDLSPYINFLLKAELDQNTKGQDEKASLDYLNKRLSGILDELEQDINLLDDDGFIHHIILFLGAGANPKVQNQDGKTLSDYLNEKLSGILGKLEQDINLLDGYNFTQHIILLLRAGADQNTKGQDGKTPLDYLSEELRGILNWLAEDSSSLGNSDVQYIMSLLEVVTNPNVQNRVGKTLLHYVAERNDIDGIKFLLKVEADPNV